MAVITCYDMVKVSNKIFNENTFHVSMRHKIRSNTYYFSTPRNLCLDLYNEWLNAEMWEKFSSSCRYQPSEEEMANCILDSK